MNHLQSQTNHQISRSTVVDEFKGWLCGGQITTVVLWPAAQLCSSVSEDSKELLHHHLLLSISAPRRNMRRRCLVTCFTFAKEKEGGEEEEPRSIKSSLGQPWHTYTLRELVRATRNFHGDHKLGEGGFGTVYWGRTKKGVEIAVKRLKAGEMTPKAEMEFAMEVEILGRVRHKNLLTLKGYHADGDERLIVYDYMPNRSLQSHLHGHRHRHRHRSSFQHPPLSWPRRMEIAIGAAEGIAYLHHEARPHVIHRDVKASNVLLDADFSAKVADFGFAKLVPEGASHVSTRVKGTLGYLAPEYAMWGKVAESCDVYSFGVLLLEIVSARRPIEKLPCGSKREIPEWAAGLAERGEWERIADPRLGGRFERGELQNAVEVALRCVDRRPEKRPMMREVVEMLREKRVVGAREEVEDGPSEPPRFARAGKPKP